MTLDITHSAIERGDRVVLHPGQLLVSQGGAIGVIGANGAGKSTLFLALAGLLRAPPRRLRIEPRPGRVSFMAQTADLPRSLTPAMIAELQGADPLRFGRAVDTLDIAELLDRRVDEISGGERQALRFAITLARPADLLILDEPFAHLDFRRRLRGVALVRDVVGQGAITLISSQNAADLVDICSDYLVLRDRRYVFCGTVEALVGRSFPPEHRLRLIESGIMALLEPDRIAVT